MIVLAFRTVRPQCTQFLSDFATLRRQHSTIARPTKVLRRIETEGPDISQTTSPPTMIFSPDRLRRILNHLCTDASRHHFNYAHLYTLPKEMHGQDDFRPCRHHRLYLRHIHIKSHGVDIYKYRPGAKSNDRAD